jgi:hypothetical protein
MFWVFEKYGAGILFLSPEERHSCAKQATYECELKSAVRGRPRRMCCNCNKGAGPPLAGVGGVRFRLTKGITLVEPPKGRRWLGRHPHRLPRTSRTLLLE